MRFHILNKKEKKEVEEKLRERFGIKEIPGILLRKGMERIFIFQGSFSKQEINQLEEWTQVERIGVYFAKLVEDKIRLSIEGVHILQNQITKNIFELDENQAEQWMTGQDLQIKTGIKGFLIMKYKDDFVGCGKASEEKIGNYIPKSRRLKSKTVIK